MGHIQICETCGTEYDFQCTNCVATRWHNDRQQEKKSRLTKFINSFKRGDIKGHIDDITSSYIDSAVEDAQDAAMAAPPLGSGLAAEPDEDEDEEFDDEDEPRLKVFQIRVYRNELHMSSPGGSWAGAREAVSGQPVTRPVSDVVTLLSKDLDSAMKQCGYDSAVHDVTLIGKEITGPFKSGFILAQWDK